MNILSLTELLFWYLTIACSLKAGESLVSIFILDNPPLLIFFTIRLVYFFWLLLVQNCVEHATQLGQYITSTTLTISKLSELWLVQNLEIHIRLFNGSEVVPTSCHYIVSVTKFIVTN